ncbi:hypothetical protein DAEQUDRAFT_771068, partial [Daedalea quercina L-15889]
TLVQLAKSARNLLVAQSRLFSFVVGIYGPKARIFRFDHAGAVCSQSFDYAEKNGAVLFEFMWRLVHPIHKDCNIVGADPTVHLVAPNTRRSTWRTRLRARGADTVDKEYGRDAARERLRAGGVDADDNETEKACRWITIKGENGKEKTYLLYELVCMNSRLFSRATTIWKALELDDSPRRWPTGKHVIIKDAWRQLARRSEAEFYRQIYAHLAADIAKPKSMQEGRDSRDGSGSSLAGDAAENSSKHTDAEVVEEYSRLSEEALMEVWGAQWPGLSMVATVRAPAYIK